MRHAAVERLDTLHFTALHLTELGLRAKDDADSDDTAQDTFSVARFDGTKNTKFNIATAATASEGRGVLSVLLILE